MFHETKYGNFLITVNKATHDKMWVTRFPTTVKPDYFVPVAFYWLAKFWLKRNQCRIRANKQHFLICFSCLLSSRLVIITDLFLISWHLTVFFWLFLCRIQTGSSQPFGGTELTQSSTKSTLRPTVRCSLSLGRVHQLNVVWIRRVFYIL